MELLDKLKEYCIEKSFALLLGGSFSKGTQNKYSDLDIVLMGKNVEGSIDEIVQLHGEPIITAIDVQKKVKTLYIVYKDGIYMDLEVRESISNEDVENNFKLLYKPNNYVIAKGDMNVCKEVNSKYLSKDLELQALIYFMFKLLMKYLAGKDISGLVNKINNYFNDMKIEININDIKDLPNAFLWLCNKYYVSYEVKNLMNTLLDNCKEELKYIK